MSHGLPGTDRGHYEVVGILAPRRTIAAVRALRDADGIGKVHARGNTVESLMQDAGMIIASHSLVHGGWILSSDN